MVYRVALCFLHELLMIFEIAIQINIQVHICNNIQTNSIFRCCLIHLPRYTLFVLCMFITVFVLSLFLYCTAALIFITM